MKLLTPTSAPSSSPFSSRAKSPMYNAGGTPVAGGFFASYSVVVYHWAYR